MKEKKYSAVEKKPRSSSKPLADPPISSSGGTHMLKKNSASKSATQLNQTLEALPFKRYQVFAFANPRSGDGLAAGFLTDFP